MSINERSPTAVARGEAPKGGQAGEPDRPSFSNPDHITQVCPPPLPVGFLADVCTWISAANPIDRQDLLHELIAEICEQLGNLEPGLAVDPDR
jgi:hypothetical protein